MAERRRNLDSNKISVVINFLLTKAFLLSADLQEQQNY